MRNKKTMNEIPEIGMLEQELQKEKRKHQFGTVFRNTLFSLVVVIAIAVIVATLILPILQINGSSMEESLYNGDIVVTVRGTAVQRGDIIAFYYNNNILIKRVIGVSGDWIDMDPDGTVYVNGERLEEDYVREKAFGECDLEFPYQVPEDRFFVMGDHRTTSIDSRSSAVGCVSGEMILGKLLFRVWPFDRLGQIQ